MVLVPLCRQQKSLVSHDITGRVMGRVRGNTHLEDQDITIARHGETTRSVETTRKVERAESLRHSSVAHDVLHLAGWSREGRSRCHKRKCAREQSKELHCEN